MCSRSYRESRASEFLQGFASRMNGCDDGAGVPVRVHAGVGFAVHAPRTVNLIDRSARKRVSRHPCRVSIP